MKYLISLGLSFKNLNFGRLNSRLFVNTFVMSLRLSRGCKRESYREPFVVENREYVITTPVQLFVFDPALERGMAIYIKNTNYIEIVESFDSPMRGDIYLGLPMAAFLHQINMPFRVAWLGINSGARCVRNMDPEQSFVLHFGIRNEVLVWS